MNDFNNDGVFDLGSVAGAAGVVTIFSANTTSNGLAATIDLSTVTGAREALTSLETVSVSLSNFSSRIGSQLSRLDSITTMLTASREQYLAAEGRIKDGDMAQESATLTRLRILQQSASAVLGQANQQPMMALRLLQSP